MKDHALYRREGDKKGGKDIKNIEKLKDTTSKECMLQKNCITTFKCRKPN